MPEPTSAENYLDEIAEEFAQKCRAGEQPSIEEYAARNPVHADEIRAVLDAVSMMERLKPRHDDDGAVGFGRKGPDRLPEQVGEFRIVREVGRGGMGVVYEAQQETLGRRVALKLLAGHLLSDEKLRMRFKRESRAAARLHHTNIVPVFGVGESDGRCFYVMQFIDGSGLDQIIRQIAARRLAAQPRENLESTELCEPPRRSMLGTNVSRANRTSLLPGVLVEAPVAADPGSSSDQVPVNKLPADQAAIADPDSSEYWRSAARIGVQVAEALAYSHSRGVLHRDIKPSNLLLDARGTVWVTDFGVAKLVEEANFTQSGEFAGTLKYMPPERFSGRSDARGDVYSLGVTLYEYLTLQPAFPQTTPQHLILQIGQGSPVPPRALNPRIPADLETIVLKAAARDPEHRYQTAAELAEDLRRFLDDRPILAKRSGPAALVWRWCRRNPALAGTTAVAFAMMVAVTVISVVAYARTEAASRAVAAANRDMEKALTAEKSQREHAEEVSNLALEALNRTYERFAPTRLVATAPTANDEGIELPAQPALPPEAVHLLEDLLRAYERIARSAGEFPGLQARAAEANQRIGDICQRLGRLEDAVTAYRMAIDLYQRPQADSDENDVRIRLARACNELGLTLRTLQRNEEARSMHERAIQSLTTAPASLADRPECRYELARSYYSLARRDLFLSPGGPPPGLPPDGPRPPGDPGRGPLGRGRDRFGFPGPPPGFRPEPRNEQAGRKAVVVLEQLVTEYPTVPEYRHLLACCYRDSPPERPGPGHQSTGSNSEKAATLLRQLVKEHPKVPDYLYDLCETLDRPAMPGPFRNADSTGQSTERIREAVTLSGELLALYANVPAYAAAHARYLNHLGMVNYRNGTFDEAEKLHRKAQRIQMKLVKQYPEVVAYGIWLSNIESGLGRDLAARGNLKDARERLENAASRIEILTKKDSRLGPARYSLGQIYRELARVLEQSGETALAAETLRKAEEFGPADGRGSFGPHGRGSFLP
jgi:serine/threonine protein kinase